MLPIYSAHSALQPRSIPTPLVRPNSHFPYLVLPPTFIRHTRLPCLPFPTYARSFFPQYETASSDQLFPRPDGIIAPNSRRFPSSVEVHRARQ
ncbi:unnamed protein product [Protopolystoma xenopodis]|uniref:Uncharacterized protein n=1 Tax=Protopolystoma xenopodis TaxID=117903 RepID=A0A3S5B4C8_9PLAT|nr:unnamed protein product [Protopolystoma xenopodis]